MCVTESYNILVFKGLICSFFFRQDLKLSIGVHLWDKALRLSYMGMKFFKRSMVVLKSSNTTFFQFKLLLCVRHYSIFASYEFNVLGYIWEMIMYL